VCFIYDDYFMQVVKLPDNATYSIQLEENLLNTPASFREGTLGPGTEADW